MNAVLKARPANGALCELVAPAADSWLAFSERHEKRLSSLIVNSFVLDHCLESIGGDVSPYTASSVGTTATATVEQKVAVANDEERHERRKKSKGAPTK